MYIKILKVTRTEKKCKIKRCQIFAYYICMKYFGYFILNELLNKSFTFYMRKI